jgi:hypothetical protein
MDADDAQPVLMVPSDPVHDALAKAQSTMSLEERFAFLMRLAGREATPPAKPK